MPDLPELLLLKSRLAEAELALHQLLIGKKTASASYEGKAVSYTQADIEQLTAYVTHLKQRIGELEGTLRPRGPIHFTF